MSGEEGRGDSGGCSSSSSNSSHTKESRQCMGGHESQQTQTIPLTMSSPTTACPLPKLPSHT